MPLPAYLPDPRKWIETSSSRSAKPTPTGQRPLVGWKHGFATPLTAPRASSSRDTAASAGSSTRRVRPGYRQNEQKEQNGVGRAVDSRAQATLGGFFTPPLTASAKKVAKAATNAFDSGSPAPVRTGRDWQPVRKSKLDHGWGSSEDEPRHSPAPRPSKASRSSTKQSKTGPRSRRSAGCSSQATRAALSAFSSGELSDLPPEYSDDSPPSSASIPPLDLAPPTKTPLVRPEATTKTPAIPSSQLHTARRTRSTQTSGGVPLHSERDLTPVPSSVLAMHRRLCGQDPKKLASIASPWVKRPSQNIDQLQLAPAPAEPVAGSSKQRTGKGSKAEKSSSKRPTSRLVELSDDEPPSRSMPLSPLRTNSIARKRKRIETAKDGASGKKRRKDETPHGIAQVAVHPPRTISAVLVVVNDIASTSSRPRSPAPPRTIPPPVPFPVSSPSQPPPLATLPFVLSSPSEPPPSTSSDLPAAISSPLVPLPRRTSPAQPEIGRCQITPPKSRSPQRRDEAFQHTMTSSPPLPPSFSPLAERIPEPKRKTFQPVEMGAETLLTWSIGQRAPVVAEGSSSPSGAAGDAEETFSDPPGSGEVEERAQNEDYSVHFTLLMLPGRTDQQFAPSITSQQFPVLLPSPTTVRARPAMPQRGSSSPTKQTRLPTSRRNFGGPSRVFETCFIAAPPAVSPDSQPTSQRPLKVDRWKALEAGILSVPAEPIIPPPASGGPGAKGKKRARINEPSQKQSQSPLAAFGFFPSKPKSVVPAFDNSWEDEADLDVEEEGGPSSSQGGSTPHPLPTGSHKVLDAPHHPSLRPAGIRELEKRSTPVLDTLHRPGPVPVQRNGKWIRNRSDPTTSSDTPSSDPALPTSEVSSSLTSSALDLPKPSPRTKEWWDNLG